MKSEPRPACHSILYVFYSSWKAMTLFENLFSLSIIIPNYANTWMSKQPHVKHMQTHMYKCTLMQDLSPHTWWKAQSSKRPAEAGSVCSECDLNLEYGRRGGEAVHGPLTSQWTRSNSWGRAGLTWALDCSTLSSPAVTVLPAARTPSKSVQDQDSCLLHLYTAIMPHFKFHPLYGIFYTLPSWINKQIR